ncbi:MAG TPA: hypothetical protein O0X27_01755 [Methanocorpusculum sp.]|nr:hypothetical protein [Methanocorpusculum sp.]
MQQLLHLCCKLFSKEKNPPDAKPTNILYKTAEDTSMQHRRKATQKTETASEHCRLAGIFLDNPMSKNRAGVKKQNRTKVTKYCQLPEYNHISKNHPEDPEPIAEPCNPTQDAEIKPQKTIQNSTRTETNKTKTVSNPAIRYKRKTLHHRRKSWEKNTNAHLAEASK